MNINSKLLLVLTPRGVAFYFNFPFKEKFRFEAQLLTACYERKIIVGRGPECSIRVAGQDGHPHSRYTCPPLTTISHDYDAVSKRAADALFEAIDGEVSPWKSTRIEGKLVLRDSA